MIKNLTIPEILSLIEKEENFEATPKDGSFSIKIQEYVPYVCCALHNGHNLRNDLQKNSNLSDYERWYEEDPHTVQFISSFPIIIEGLDSRYEYDLNRNREEAIYTTAWDKNCWKKPLTQTQIDKSLKKYDQFYTILHALIQKLEKKHNACVVFDIHSYNYQRWDKKMPVFNIGTKYINTNAYKKTLQRWKKELSQIEIPEIETDVTENEVFEGRGFMLQYLSNNFNNTLVLATDIKKIYCSEIEGKTYPIILQSLSEGLKTAIINTVMEFTKTKTNLLIKNKANLLSSELSPDILEVDRQLQDTAREIELLALINPLNLITEKKNFFKNKCKINPDFKYKPININALDVKRKLTAIPIEKIDDINIQQLYVDSINYFMDKVDLASSFGSEKFLYNSLRYFGEPSKKEIDNARFLLYCPDFGDEKDEEVLTTKEAELLFADAAKHYNFDLKISSSANIVSKVLAMNSKKTIIIKKGIKFSKRLIDGLIEHEIGVHMVTSLNAKTQPLRLFSIGFPNNTMTQEGLSVFAEYLSNNINLTRLRELAIRTLGIRSMLDGNDFKTTFDLLVEEHNFSPDSAFNITVRFYRGGGFTKDYLYLKGLTTILSHFNKKKSLTNLLVGKTSIEHIDIIDEMINRGMINQPTHLTKAFEKYEQTKHINPTLQYIFSGLK